MSYDLFFKATDRQPDRHDFEEYFDERCHYSIDDTAVWYENDSTGVYFSFELSDAASDKDDFGADDESAAQIAEEEGDDYWVVFNMNYARPHVFALEALREVRAFIDHFNLAIDDPQTGGMAQGPFSDAGFLSGWNHGNALACGTLAHEKDRFRNLYPTDLLERNWRWNVDVVERQDRLMIDVFIPTIMYIKHGGIVKSVVVWPDAISIFLPRVEMVIISRNELAQPPIADDAPGETAIVDWADLEPLLAAYSFEQSPAAFYKLAYEIAPDDLVRFIQSRPQCQDDMQGLGKDEILNAELFLNA